MKYPILLSGVIAGSLPMASVAQTPEPGAGMIDEIMVTAQRRSERSVDVPISLNAISQEDMNLKRIDSVYDLAKSVTSLRFEGQAPVFMPTLRGVGTLVLGGALDASVPVYVDGVYMANTRGMNFDFPNISSIQVLKGPQGTLFGRNSTGGAILISTAEPSETFTANLKATYARFNDRRLQGYVSGPLADGITAGLSINHRTSDGYTKNIVTGSDSDAGARMLNVRPDVRFQFSDDLALRLIYEHNFSTDATALGLNNPDGYALAHAIPGAVVATEPFETAADWKPLNRNQSYSGTAILDWDLGGSLALKSITNYREDTNEFNADADVSNLPLVHVGGDVDFRTYSQEVTLNGQSGELDWVSGLYYYHNTVQEKNGRNLIFGVPFPGGASRFETENLAAFVDGTYQVSPGLFLTAGLRVSTETKDHYLRDQVTGDFLSPPRDKRWTSVTPRAVVRYEIGPDTNVYGSYSRGYKTGTFAGSPPTLVDPEHMDAFEVGFKHSSPTFTFNAAAFLYNYEDFQVSAVDIANNTTTAVNADKQRNYGLELEGSYSLSPQLRVNLAVAYLEAEFKDFDNAPLFLKNDAGGWFSVAADASGTRAPRSPEWSGNAAIVYDLDLDNGVLQLAANLTANSVLYNITHEQFPVRGYAEVGANISYTPASGHWRAELFGSNLTDHERPQQYQGSVVGTYAIWAPPRIIGASLSYNF